MKSPSEFFGLNDGPCILRWYVIKIYKCHRLIVCVCVGVCVSVCVGSLILFQLFVDSYYNLKSVYYASYCANFRMYLFCVNIGRRNAFYK